ncbi:MAG: acetylxylan esterase [Candidatus Latescibacteria bacterium]|nr:acetylxylan esterase [Candidatus Latescibacterota bacterium]
MPQPFQPTTARPDDFDAYWEGAMAALAELPAAAEVSENPMRSTEFCTSYMVRLTSLGPYRIFGYLSIPKGDGPFPTLVYLSRHQSVVEVLPQGDANEKRSRYLVFSLAARGQRNADKPYAASFPGLFTDGIQSPQTYVFRGIVADCCRAVEYVLSRPEVDRSRVLGLVANELSILTCALQPGLTHAVVTPSFLYAAMDRAPKTDAYPLEELNDFLRLHPERRETVARTLAYFEPLFFAPKVNIPTLLWGNAEETAPLAGALGGQVEARESEGSRFRDGVYQEQWIARQLGFDDAILSPAWERR